MTRRLIIVGIRKEECRALPWLCRTWTQILVQACSSNWTAISSAIQQWQRCQWCRSFTEGCPAEAGGFLASCLPLLDNACRRQSQQYINAVGFAPGVQAHIFALMSSTSFTNFSIMFIHSAFLLYSLRFRVCLFLPPVAFSLYFLVLLFWNRIPCFVFIVSVSF